MTEPCTPRSLGRSVVRYHSPYCEATGPIVKEGTVAARIQALQSAARDNLDVVRSYTPVTPNPPCKLIPDWRPGSALGSRSPDRQRFPKSHSQLADYIFNDLSQHSEEPVPDIVRNQSLAFSTSNSRRKSTAVLGHRSRTPLDAERPKPNALQTPPAASLFRNSREPSWKQTIKQNVAARSAKSISEETGSPESIPSKPTAAGDLQDEIWPNNRPMLRKVLTDNLSDATKSDRQNISIAEQIGEMIDRALQGRDDATQIMTPQSSLLEFSDNRSKTQKGELDRGHFTRDTRQNTETQARISPGSKQVNTAQDLFTSRVPEVGTVDTKTRPYHGRRYDGRYSSASDNYFSRDGSDTEKHFLSKPATGRTFETPTHHPRPRACTYTTGRPLCLDDEEHVPNSVTRRSISSAITPSQERLLCNNDLYEVSVRETHEHHDKSSCKTRSTIPKDRTRRPSLRKYAATAPRPPPHRSYNQSQGQGSSHKRWKWWKLVMVDKEPSHGRQSDTEGQPRKKSTWGPATHPLAGYVSHDVGHEPSYLVERLERACTEQECTEQDPPSAQPHLVDATKSSERTMHTLAQCGHEEDDNLEPLGMSGDGSWDVFRSTTTSTSGTITHCTAAKPQMRVKITSIGRGIRVEVKTEKQHGREKSGVKKSIRAMKVLVTLQEGKDSAVRVKISPKPQ